MRYLRKQPRRAANWLLARIGLPILAKGGIVARPGAKIIGSGGHPRYRRVPGEAPPPLTLALLRGLAARHPALLAQALAGCLDGHPPDAVARIMHPTLAHDVFLCERCETIYEEKPSG